MINCGYVLCATAGHSLFSHYDCLCNGKLDTWKQCLHTETGPWVCQSIATGKPMQIKCLCIYKGVWSLVMTASNYVMRCKRNGQLPGYGTVNGAGELNTATNMQWGNNRGAPSPTYWGCSTVLYAIKQGHHLSPGLFYDIIHMQVHQLKVWGYGLSLHATEILPKC